jgi:hypothetical protein
VSTVNGFLSHFVPSGPAPVLCALALVCVFICAVCLRVRHVNRGEFP